MNEGAGWVQTQVIEANKIIQTIKIKLVEDGDYSLICNKGSALDIYTIVSHGDTKQSRRESVYLRQNTHKINTFIHPYLCPITKMEVLSPPHLPVDLLCIVSADFRFSILFYSPSSQSLEILWTYKTFSSWECNFTSGPKIQIHPSQEIIGIIPTGTNIMKLFKFCFSLLKYDPSRGIYCPNNHEVPFRMWNFIIFGSVLDFVFYEQRNTVTHGARVLGGAKKDRSGGYSTNAVPSSSLPNSPRGYSMTPSPRISSPYVGSYTSPSASPIYHSQPTSPFGAIANLSPSSGDPQKNSFSRVPSVSTEEYVTIYVLLQVTENSTKHHLKKLKFHLHSNQLKEDSVTETFPIGSMLLSTSNNGYK